ncbi:iron-sulfur cluster assembly scaffold protein [Pseudoxanthobacter sp.]|uniref:iron-sulfur cluster assembly scaffold protein n=1 Tax=Pseudoxanthobacter sp. TaxID=1925742 RepID=UPI002FE3C53E
MTDTVYSSAILELAASMPHVGRLAAPQGTARRQARLCGSVITVDVVLADGRVAEFAQEVRACALGQAAASLFGRAVVGAGIGEVRAVRDAMTAMLKENGPPPQGRFAALAVLEPVRDYRARHGSTLLVFEATVAAIDAALAGAAA